MWAAQSINLLPGQRFLTSGGLGAMGFALPAAIGVATVTSKPWVVVTGDGCLQLSLGELQTAVHLNSDLLILLFNNAQLGMVAQFQEGNLQGRYVSTRDGYSTPDFQRIVEAFGIYCTKISNWEDFDFKVDSAINRKGPRLIEFEIDQNAKALPKLDFKGSLRDL
jgi:acetolactate synthase-1/2/3 large subunit